MAQVMEAGSYNPNPAFIIDSFACSKYGRGTSQLGYDGNGENPGELLQLIRRTGDSCAVCSFENDDELVLVCSLADLRTGQAVREFPHGIATRFDCLHEETRNVD